MTADLRLRAIAELGELARDPGAERVRWRKPWLRAERLEYFDTRSAGMLTNWLPIGRATNATLAALVALARSDVAAARREHSDEALRGLYVDRPGKP